MKRAVILSLLLSACGTPPKEERPKREKDSRRLVPEDLFRLKEVVDVSLSPKGHVAYTLRSFDPDGDRYDHQIWVVLPGKGPVQITREEKGASSPAWSPDGSRLACVLSSTGKSQIWTMAPDGTDRRQVTDVPRGAAEPAWSPDGARIAFLSAALPDEREPPGKVDEEEAPDPRIVAEPTYRREGRFLSGVEPQIFVVDLESGGTRQITSGRHAASKPTWSPDATRLAFASSREEPKYFAHNSDIWIVTVDGVECTRFTQNRGPDFSPAWSPDGKWIAYLGHGPQEWGVWQVDLWIRPVDGGEPRNLTAEFDRTVNGPVSWSPKSDVLYFRAPDRGSLHVYGLYLEVGEPDRVSPEQSQCYGYDVTEQGMALIVTTPRQPAEVLLRPWDSIPDHYIPLTYHNDDWLYEVRLVPQEEITYESEGCAIQGWYQPPFGARPGAKVPMILEIHGGPAWHYGWRWFFELQLLSASGYAVFYTNPRGSTGYGEKFLKANERDWGGGDYRDIMAGVDHILGAKSEIDAENLGVTGGSYGGYMTNWVIGHTDRFRAAVTQRCVSNLVSFVNSDIHMWIAESYFNTTPWDGHELLWKHSPIAYVRNMKTPLRIIHSEGDYRTPINQADELFVSLKRLDQAPVDFVRYPLPEGHNLSRTGTPSRRLDRLERILEWFDRYLEGQTVRKRNR